MPPEQPSILSSFLAMITRRRALDRYRYKNAQRRADEQTLLSLLELEECVSGDKTLYEAMREEELARALNSFLSSLPEKECNVFLRRYWYFDSIKDICRRYGYGESKVKMMLKRTRDRLSEYLEKEELI